VSEALPPIYFVRHGETEWNRLGLIQGGKDILLNETGHAQARNVARAIAEHPEVTRECRFAVSPLGRTRQTMTYISQALSLPESHVTISPALKELSFGVWEGKPLWELKASPLYPADPETRYSWRPEGGESYADGRERLRHWLAEIEDPTIVVSHGAIGRSLIGHLTAMNMRELVEIRMHQGQFCRIADGAAEWFDGTPLPP
jgi:broad specificity phosphatase PhoE